MPKMKKLEYDKLIREEYICRIAFKGDIHPHIAPFLYIVDGKFMYFLSTKYGKKLQHFRANPLVVVEIEKYAPDLSSFAFVSLTGRLEEVQDPKIKRIVRQGFVELIKNRNLSPNVLSALGHSPNDPVESLLTEERNNVWRLRDVNEKEMLGLKHIG